MKKNDFKPFKNESDCVQLGEDFTIENRLDRVSIFGSIDLTRDKPGLEYARQLKGIIDLTISEMEKNDLPDKVTLIEPETVKNPFA